MALSFPLQGAFTALVTPFSESGQSIDWAAFEALVERQIAAGIAGLVPCGTTGETPTLSDAEVIEVVTRTVAVARGRVPVIAGTGSFSTKKTIETSRHAIKAGACAVMIVMPYYSKPTQEGLFEHVVTVANAVEAPIVLYNIPSRTQSDLAADTTERICAAASNVVALKDGTGNILRCQELVRRLGDRLTVLSGDDALTLAMMAVGAKGVISVTSNLYPDKVSEIVTLMLASRWDEARKAHLRLMPVHDAMFLEANPGPIKAALAAKGIVQPSMRLPLVPPQEAIRARLAAVVRMYEEIQ